ncbi:MAG: L,D-transpeptidase [Thiolinea sp.]
MSVIRWLSIFAILTSQWLMTAQANEHHVNEINPVAGDGQIHHPPVDGLLRSLAERFPEYSTDQVILIDATIQRLMLIEYGQVVDSWIISTAEAGLGSRKGSNQTPLGVHRIKKRFGDGAAPGTVFKARRNTGRIAKILTEPGARSREDNVTTRILWLDGLEPGRNKGGNVDSFGRYIYIHGTDEEGRLGQPASHGCIRMRNLDVIDLYNRVGLDTLVVIAQQRSR